MAISLFYGCGKGGENMTKDEKSKELEIIPSEVVSMPIGGPNFNPRKIISEANKAARALKKVINGKPKKVIINGEQYLEFEDWQTLGYFYGYSVETGEAEEIIREDKIVGYKAKSIVFKNGVRVGGAEASCLRDEKNWGEKPEFQLKSMAQTRAGAKGLRNVLAWVAVLAGYKPTPAEELIHNGKKYNSSPASLSNGKAKYPYQPTALKCVHCGTTGKFHASGCPNYIKPEE